MFIIKYRYVSIIFISILYLIIFCIPGLSGGTGNAMKYSDIVKYGIKKKLWIHKLKIESGIVYKLNTAQGYVSVITLPVIPLDVALGNTGAFSEQIVGKQIFIKPITYDAGTTSNLEIFTKYGLINVLLRIRSSKNVTYNLNLADTLKNVFAVNYLKNKIDKLKRALLKKYTLKMRLVNEKKEKLRNEKKEVMDLILLINRIKINKFVSKNGVTLTVISLSRIRNIYYLQYQLTNNSDKTFFVRNVYLYDEHGGSFLNGYDPNKIKEISIINRTPHDAEYMPYELIKNVIIFKEQGLKQGDDLELSFHIIISKKLVRLRVKDFLIKNQ